MVRSIIEKLFLERKARIKVRVAYNNLINSLPFYIALENGYFEAEGIQVESSLYQNAPEVTSALLSGKADLGMPIATAELFMAEAKAPNNMELFIGIGETKKFRFWRILVKKDSKIKSLDDIKNVKIGTITGITGEIYIKLLFEEIFGQNKAKIVKLKTSQWLAALKSGKVDALFSVEPITTIAIKSNLARSIADAPLVKYFHEPIIPIGFAMSKEFISKNPETAEKIVTIVKKAIVYMKLNPDQNKRILAKYADLPESFTREILPNDMIAGVYVDAKQWQEDIQFIANHLHRKGWINKKVNVSDIIYKKRQIS